MFNWFLCVFLVNSLAFTIHNGEYVELQAGGPLVTYWARLDFACSNPPVRIHSLQITNTLLMYESTKGSEYFYITRSPQRLDFEIVTADTSNYRYRKTYTATLCLGNESAIALLHPLIGIQGDKLTFPTHYTYDLKLNINTTRIESYGVDLPPQYINVLKEYKNTTITGITDLGYGYGINSDIIFDYLLGGTFTTTVGSTEQVPLKEIMIFLIATLALVLLLDLNKDFYDPINKSLIAIVLSLLFNGYCVVCNYDSVQF